MHLVSFPAPSGLPVWLTYVFFWLLSSFCLSFPPSSYRVSEYQQYQDATAEEEGEFDEEEEVDEMMG